MNAGERCGPFVLLRQVGQGAMGAVYLAQDTRSGRPLALKLVYKGGELEDQEMVDAERAGAALQHRLHGVDPRIVEVFEWGDVPPHFYIAMEFVDGDDLSALIARAPMSPGFAVYVAHELCDMLENLRSFATSIGDRQFYGVVHGDLKPRNIRVDKLNHVKVVDFGIAKALTYTHKQTVNLFASAAYCSPERLQTQTMDSHSDLWSVGVLLYQMLAGRLPFEETNRERLEARIRSGRPLAPLAGCPEPLQHIVFKMLARNPAHRYATPGDASADLARFQTNQPVLAASLPQDDLDATRRTAPTPSITENEGTVRTAPPPLPPNSRSSPHVPVRPRRSFRSYALLGCVGVVGLLAIALMIYVSVQVHFWNDAQRFEASLESDRVNNLDAAWNDFEILNKRPHWGVLLWGAQRTLRKRLVAAADEIISEYRDSNAPSVFEPQWMAARTDLARALELDPGNTGIEGELRLTQAHIDRIEANSLKAAARQKRLNSAVTKFQEAQSLLKHSPDPELGLASLYVYDLNDVEKAETALNQAARNGHRLGSREIAQLGDAYRRRADRTWRESRAVSAMPGEERSYLEQAKTDYLRAQQLYARAGVFGDSVRNKMQAVRGEQRVEERLAELGSHAVMQ